MVHYEQAGNKWRKKGFDLNIHLISPRTCLIAPLGRICLKINYILFLVIMLNVLVTCKELLILYKENGCRSFFDIIKVLK